MEMNFSSWSKLIARYFLPWFVGSIGFIGALVTIFFQGTSKRTPLIILPFLFFIGIVHASYRVFKRMCKNNIAFRHEKDLDFDVFLAAPMAAYKDNQEYQDGNKEARGLMSLIRQHCGLNRIFYSGEDVPSKEDFDPEDIAYIGNLEKIRKSKYFLLYYPRNIVSSVLIELGYAIAFNLPIIILTKSLEELPYLLKKLPQASPANKIYEFNNQRDIKNIISKHGKTIFDLVENVSPNLFAEFID
ncbi:MAG: hypothetical protein PHI34_03500 [Acidobacteriota bacterium]|nr:hypothetical protein [Acidobacteriota bacterium]